MNLSFLTPNRTVLLITDDGLYIYSVNATEVVMVEFLDWETNNFENHVADLIKRECGGKPVLLLNDMTDQHFKGGQRLPKVGPLDRASVLKRRLAVAFPNYAIRGALQTKTSKKKKDPKGPSYLFTAIPMSDPVTKTLSAVKNSLANISGFCLLPVESTDMVAQISKKLVAKNAEPAKWSVFIGQHKNGSLRQVITRDGQLAMTRMTPISDISKGVEQWAADVAQEYKATISYLSRFGYSPEETTDLIVIGNKEATQLLDETLNIDGRFVGFTNTEAARILGIKIGKQDNDLYADILHAAWIGKKTRFALPMEAKELESIHKPRQMAAIASFAMFLAVGFLSYQLFVNSQNLLTTRSDIEDQTFILSNVEKDYQYQVDKMNALGFNIELIQGSLGAYETFENERANVLFLAKQIARALGNDLRLDELLLDTVEKVQQPTPGGYQAYGQTKKTEKQLEVLIKLSFPTTIQPEVGIKEVNALRQRLRAALPDYDVDIARQVARPDYTEKVTGVATEDEELISSAEDYTAELILTRVLDNSEGQ